MSQNQIFETWQRFLASNDIPGWLIHDFRNSNPIFNQVLPSLGHVTRPTLLYIPALGKPMLLVHHVDAGKFAYQDTLSSDKPDFDLTVYQSRNSMVDSLQSILRDAPRVAMEYSPNNDLPRVSRVDAGTVELVRSLGSEVVSSADLMQFSTQRWSTDQLSGHKRAAAKLGNIVNQAFELIGTQLKNARHTSDAPSEFFIAEYIRQRFLEENLTTADGPIVSINSHCSDPHYEPTPENTSIFRPGDWVLIDLLAKESSPSSVYADITWVAYIGAQIPKQISAVFETVIEARDSALEFLKTSFEHGAVNQGWEVDKVARDYINSKGYGEFFTHRLGHSISYEVHGEAVNLDNFETHDNRSIIPGIGFSIEPGIYLPDFGVRSEIDAYMSEDGPYATSPVQREIVLISAD